MLEIRAVNIAEPEGEVADESIENPEWRRRQDLARFLRARRAAFSPKDVGLPIVGRRRAPGLRREELAQIAGIGVTWYTWLEQGREINVSVDLLRRLTQALKLTPHDSAYLYSLAGHPMGPPATQEDRSLIEGLQAVLDGYRSGPAGMVDGVGTVIAYNKIADQIYRFSGYESPWGDNLFWRLFMDSYRRSMYVNWNEIATLSVGLMRGVYASRKHDMNYQRMIDDLCDKCPEFRRMWDESAPHGTSPIVPSPIHVQAPGIGEMRFLSVRLLIPTREGWAFFFSPLDEATASAVRRFMKANP